MFDRFINVVTLVVVFICAAVLFFNLEEAYKNVGYRFNISDAKPWERYNEHMKIFDEEYSSEKLKVAIENASKAGDKEAVGKLSERYALSYTDSGERRTRLNSMEWENSLIYSLAASLLLLVPILANYIRHGRFLLWNKAKT